VKTTILIEGGPHDLQAYRPVCVITFFAFLRLLLCFIHFSQTMFSTLLVHSSCQSRLFSSCLGFLSVCGVCFETVWKLHW